MKIRIIKPFTESFLDYPDNFSSCISVYMTGCWGLCDQCHNKQLINQHYENSIETSLEQLISELKKYSKRCLTNKITLLGGDPLYITNIDFTREFLKQTKDFFDVCVYTGQDIDFVIKNNITGFEFIKCGLYREDKKIESDKTDDYFQLGSTNQKIYNKEFKLISKDGKLIFQ